MTRKVVIESADYGNYEGETFEQAIDKAIEEFAQYDSETFEIDTVEVDGYFLCESSTDEIQAEIEDGAKRWKKEAELEYKGRTEWTHPDTGGRI